ncbi:MAG: mannitol dehydrogenase [Clostridia bacterium]|nr:mannitol dehydrogenase [Clostridia bacterium]
MKQAIMYGAGNIGRGFIGQLFHMSGYEISFIDVNMTVIDKLNSDGQYPVYITDGDDYREYLVTGVHGVNGRDNEAIAEAIASADIMATAVGVNILKFIAAPFAGGVRRRMEKGIEAPLNVIICENMIEADKYFAGLVKENLNDAEKAYFDAHIALVEPSIGRMVPATPKEIAEKNPLAVCVEPYCELPVDKNAFKGEVPAIENMVPFAPFDFFIRRKLFMHNMSHALTAYFGARKGYTYIWEAAKDAEVKLLTLRALTESSRALSKEYGVPLEELLCFSENLISRFENKLLGDTVERVGRDTKRKLSANDRFVGAARLCEKHGIKPVTILAGLAAGLHFAPEGDEASAEVVADVKQNGVAHALATYCGVEADSSFLPTVEAVYRQVADATPMSAIISSLQIY